MLHAHLVSVARLRHPVSTRPHLERLEETMRAVCGDFEGELAEFNSETDHVHLLVHSPPKIRTVAKGQQPQRVSSRRMHHEYPELARHYWRANKLWSASYVAGSIGDAPISLLRHHIDQHTHPARRAEHYRRNR